MFFEGRIFVLTGFDEEEAGKITDLIIAKGGKVKSSTVLKTNYLVVKENYDHQTTKYKRAVELKEKGNKLFIVGSKRFYELVE